MWRFIPGVVQPPKKKVPHRPGGDTSQKTRDGETSMAAAAQEKGLDLLPALPSSLPVTPEAVLCSSPGGSQDAPEEPPSPPSLAPNQAKSQKPARVYQRKFSENWRYTPSGVKRTWLDYNAKEKIMSCHVCRTHAKGRRRTNQLVLGSPSLKLETIVSHESSACHGDCVAAAKAQSLPLKEQPSVRALTKLSDVTMTKMKILFNNAHAIAKHARPYTDYVWMCS